MIKNEWPPNIEDIRAVLPVTERNIFAHNNTIYAPGGGKIEPWLVAHEKVHFEQQARHGVDQWWENFLASPKFRLEQEIPAHRAEYRYWLEMQPRPRNHRRVMLKDLAKRLSAPMYGSIISQSEAKRMIR